jgi:hypothetical protein
MAFPPKKKAPPFTAKANSADQVHGAIAAFVAKKGKMSKKTKKRVAGRLKGMAGGK